jgi:hypothetical protein
MWSIRKVPSGSDSEDQENSVLVHFEFDETDRSIGKLILQKQIGMLKNHPCTTKEAQLQ